MPSGNQAGLLYRDSTVIISLGLLLLGTSVSHKHHLPENRSACLEHLSAGQGVVPSSQKKEKEKLHTPAGENEGIRQFALLL